MANFVRVGNRFKRKCICRSEDELGNPRSMLTSTSARRRLPRMPRRARRRLRRFDRFAPSSTVGSFGDSGAGAKRSKLNPRSVSLSILVIFLGLKCLRDEVSRICCDVRFTRVEAGLSMLLLRLSCSVAYFPKGAGRVGENGIPWLGN